MRQSLHEIMKKSKPFINKCNWEGIRYLSKMGNDDWETFDRLIQKLPLMFYALKNWRHVPLIS